MKRITKVVWASLVSCALGCSATTQVNPVAIEHSGMGEASAAVPVGRKMFLVASDDDNVLRVFRNDAPGIPVHTFDLNSFLKLTPDHPEADIEGATLVGDCAYWITSHGTNKDGKKRPNRHRFFATNVKLAGDTVTITPVGTPYKNLVPDLAAAPHLTDLNLGDAANKSPETEGGLNIEGLCATPEGSLLIAFRNPVPDGKALIVPLENPQEVINGAVAKFGVPISLPLGGLGIRSIEYFEAKRKYLIVAGPHDSKGEFKLFQWSGPSSQEPELLRGVNFKGFHPEALVVYPEEKTKVQILSDDGPKGNFRSFWISP